MHASSARETGLQFLMRRQAATGFLDSREEPACELLNTLFLLELQRLGGNQLTAHAQRRRTGQDVAESRLLIHSTRSYKRDLRKRRFQRPDVMVATKWRAGKNLDEVRAGFPRVDDLARCQSARNNEYAFPACKLRHFVNEAGARQESRPCI